MPEYVLAKLGPVLGSARRMDSALALSLSQRMAFPWASTGSLSELESVLTTDSPLERVLGPVFVGGGGEELDQDDPCRKSSPLHPQCKCHEDFDQDILAVVGAMDPEPNFLDNTPAKASRGSLHLCHA